MNLKLISTGLTLFLVACLATPSTKPTVEVIAPDGKAITVEVEIADNDAEWERGLMERDNLDPNTGMLFLFQEPQVLSFWMKDTLIPLDILFFDANGNLVSAATMQPCEADPCPVTNSARPSLYALEVPAGFVVDNKVGPGWKILLPHGPTGEEENL